MGIDMGRLESFQIQKFSSRVEADRAVSDAIARALNAGIQSRGQASAMLSGGSTPINAYGRLSQQKLDWSNVQFGLVDDRWVDNDQDGSNEKMLIETLLQNEAAGANLIGLKTEHASAKQGLSDVEKKLRKFNPPFDICVMGMGTDGHTASWFPGSRDLPSALNIDNVNLACAVNASGAPGAGAFPDRISLTLPAVMNSGQILLYITGDEKLNILEEARHGDVFDKPVKALFAAGRNLSIYWAP